MTFPNVAIGTCPECGGKGQGDSSASGADAPSTATGGGIPLVLYKGRYICEMCRHRLQNTAQSRIMRKRDAQEEKFRAKVGFKKTVT